MMVAYTDILTSFQINGSFNLGKVYEQMAKEKYVALLSILRMFFQVISAQQEILSFSRAKSASINVEDMLTLGQFHLTCASFHLANGDINSALNAGKNIFFDLNFSVYSDDLEKMNLFYLRDEII